MHSTPELALDFTHRRSIDAADLKRLVDPAVIFEGTHVDEDGAVAYLYTVAGVLDGTNIFTRAGGCTVGGDAMLIHADSREHADLLAGMGLEDTINALHTEDERYIDAQAALARLATLNPVQRLELATKPAADKSDAFVNDVDAIRPLIGDDIVLASGGVKH
jgi:hypothetical protein